MERGGKRLGEQNTRRPRHCSFSRFPLPSRSLSFTASRSPFFDPKPRRSVPAVVLARQRGSARKEEKKRGGPALASIVGATFFFPSSEGAEAERSKGKISKAKSELRSACSSAPLRSGSPLSLPLPVTTRQGAGRLLSAGEERAVERRQGAGERST